MFLSVIICTHNPREDYLRRVLEALENQTLSKDKWELLLIDNASVNSLANEWDLSWHPSARHIREEELGLTPARLRGICESKGEILVFVDDDNVLAADYLAMAIEIFETRPWMGAFGGDIRAEFEVEPDPSLGKLVDWVGVIRVDQEHWCKGPGCSAMVCAPIGAGMVILKEIAEHYVTISSQDKLRRKLDRSGDLLFCHGDTDMALCSCDLGFAVGRFPSLKIKHLISKKRVTEEYIFRLIESAAFSDAVFRFVREGVFTEVAPQSIPSRSEKILRRYQAIMMKMRGIKTIKSNFQKFDEAWLRGVTDAGNYLEKYRLKD